MEQERHTSVLISILQSLAEIKRALVELNSLVQQRKLVAALKKRCQTLQLISALPGAYTSESEPLIYTTIKHEFDRLEKEIISILQTAFSSAFRFDSKTRALVIVTSPFASNMATMDDMIDAEDEVAHSIPLSTCLVMLEALRLAEPKFHSIASTLHRFIDSFLVEPTQLPLPTLKGSRTRNEAVLAIIDGKENTFPLHLIMTGLSTTIGLFQFLTDHLIVPMFSQSIKFEPIWKCGSRDSSLQSSVSTLCSSLGSSILSYIVDRLVYSSFEPSLPQQRAQLDEYQRSVSAEFDRFVPHLSTFSWLNPINNATELPQLSPNQTGQMGQTGHGWAFISRFVDFLKNSQLHFAIRKKRITVARARELLLSGVYTSQMVGDIDFGISASVALASQGSSFASLTSSIFKFPRCRVRDVVVELVGMCENLIAEAFEPPIRGDSSSFPSDGAVFDSSKNSEIQMILLETAKDILDLYRCIVPTFDENRITRTPSLAMIFHNDCQYISHRITLLGGTYRVHMMRAADSKLDVPPLDPLRSSSSSSSSPPSHNSAKSNQLSLRAASASLPPAERHFSFVDLIPVFRSLGEQYYLNIVTAMREHLISLLEGMSDLVDTHRPERKRRCLISMREIVSELEKTDGMWSDTLPRELHKVTLGLLINCVAEWMIERVFKFSDFSADETESLNQIFAVLFPVAKLFLDLSDISSVVSGGDEKTIEGDAQERQARITKESCAKYVSSWLQYEDLTDVFNMPMATIAERYNDGNMHFKRAQLISLIKALFTDSTKRAEKIASLRNDLP